MTLFLYGALGGVLFLLPFELMERRGLSGSEVGLTLLPLGLIIGVLSRRAGVWADRAGPRPPLASGAALAALAAAGLAIGVSEFWLGVLARLIALALGMGLVVAPLTTAVINAAPDAQSGAASGVNNAASRLAGLFAVAILGSVASAVYFAEIGAAPPLTAGGELRFGALPSPDAPERAALEAAFRSAYAAAMWIAAAWAGLAALIALMLPRNVARA